MTAKDGEGTLRCRLLGHRCRYEIVSTDPEEVLATCVRRACDYEKLLNEEWYEQRKKATNTQ